MTLHQLIYKLAIARHRVLEMNDPWATSEPLLNTKDYSTMLEPTAQGTVRSAADADGAEVNAEAYVVLVVTVIFVIMGFVGNSLVIAIYSKRNTFTSTDIMILTLSVIDLFTTVTIMPFTPVVAFTHVNRRYRMIAVGAVFLLENFSIFVLVCISFDRFLVIYKPSSRRDSRYAGGCIAGGLVFTVVFGLAARASKDIGTYGLVVYVLLSFLILLVMYSLIFVLLKRHTMRVVPMLAGVQPVVPAPHSTPRTSRENHNSEVSVTYLTNSRDHHVNSGSGQLIGVNAMMHVETPRCLHGTSTTNGQRMHPFTISERVADCQSNKPSLRNQEKQPGAANISGQRQRELMKIARITCVVTIVFVMSYFPILLLQCRVIDQSSLIPYTFIYINHTANPVIYSFGSTKFRRDTRQVFQRLKSLCSLPRL